LSYVLFIDDTLDFEVFYHYFSYNDRETYGSFDYLLSGENLDLSYIEGYSPSIPIESYSTNTLSFVYNYYNVPYFDIVKELFTELNKSIINRTSNLSDFQLLDNFFKYFNDVYQQNYLVTSSEFFVIDNKSTYLYHRTIFFSINDNGFDIYIPSVSDIEYYYNDTYMFTKRLYSANKHSFNFSNRCCLLDCFKKNIDTVDNTISSNSINIKLNQTQKDTILDYIKDIQSIDINNHSLLFENHQENYKYKEM
jgi:6-pyruvoyl-tetrahydropterin synthase